MCHFCRLSVAFRSNSAFGCIVAFMRLRLRVRRVSARNALGAPSVMVVNEVSVMVVSVMVGNEVSLIGNIASVVNGVS